MIEFIDSALYEFSQLLILPVITIISLLLGYAFLLLGGFSLQLWQRHRGHHHGFEIISLWNNASHLSENELELLVYQRLTYLRITVKIAPMFGLVATMIPMGPALRALGDGELADVSTALSRAFSAVIVALSATIIIHVIYHVKRGWYLNDLSEIEKLRGGGS